MISRRSFFAKLAGAVVAAKVVPRVVPPVWGSTGGAHIGGFANFGQGTLAMLHGPERIIPLDVYQRHFQQVEREFIEGTGDPNRQPVGFLNYQEPKRDVEDVEAV